MKKIYCNKIAVSVLVIMFFIVFDMSYFALLYQNEHIVLLVIAIILINIIFIPLISYLFIRKKSRIIIITDTHFEYINKDDSFKISLQSIDYFSYMKSASGFYDLSINLLNGSCKNIILTKGVIKKIAKLSKKQLRYYKNENLKTINEEISDWFNELKEDIVENRFKILFAVIGLILSTCFIIIHNYYNTVLTTILLCSISFVFACLQLYFFYLKDFNKIERIILSILAIIVICAIFFGINCILFHKVFNIIDILIYSFYILPAFIIVIMIIILFIAALGYA